LNKRHAIQEVESLGGYFYAEIPEHSDTEILAGIEDDVHGSALTGLYTWERARDSLAVVLAECTQEELDDLLLNGYAHDPASVNSREFLSNLHELIARAIEERRKS
jgi:hypothetical protein